MFVRFVSNASNVERGFNLTWTGLNSTTPVTATGGSISRGQVFSLQHQ